jgi:hypothetical protein
MLDKLQQIIEIANKMNRDINISIKHDSKHTNNRISCEIENSLGRGNTLDEAITHCLTNYRLQVERNRMSYVLYTEISEVLKGIPLC